MIKAYERECYENLMKIQEICDNAYAAESPVAFEYIWQVCQDQVNQLKISIGERVIEEESTE